MVIRFSWGKLTRPNQSTITSSGTTTVASIDNVQFIPYGSTGAATAAPSTLIVDNETKAQYLCPKAYSAVNAALTAVTSSSDAITIY
jgi:hypothetical protein